MAATMLDATEIDQVDPGVIQSRHFVRRASGRTTVFGIAARLIDRPILAL